ncbi:MAG: hypothetical protein OHK0021_11820 [Bryobacter sp.]
MARLLNPARTFLGGGGYLFYLRESNEILRVDESTMKFDRIAGPPVNAAINSASVTTCDGRVIYFAGTGKQTGALMYVRTETGTWMKHRYQQFGKVKEYWAPTIFYCSAEGVPVAAISYNELSEVR